jgi:hypothetical protein
VIRDDMTALGIISSLEYVLSRFEVEPKNRIWLG